MKIRYGYVSNSSSSSFILVFDKIPGSVDELEGMLNFENIRTEISYEEYAQRVFWDIQGAEVSDEQLLVFFENVLYDKVRKEYNKAWDEKDMEKRCKLLEKAKKKLSEQCHFVEVVGALHSPKLYTPVLRK